MKSILPFLILFGLLRASPTVEGAEEAYQANEGDVVFQSLPHNDLVDAIEGVSRSKISHCGIVVRRKGEWLVLEALSTVHETAFAEWIGRGRSNWILVCRLSKPFLEKIPAFTSAAEALTGRAYDYSYSFDNEEIYCSELIYIAAERALGKGRGHARRLEELNWRPYETFIRSMDHGKLALDRKMITPVDLFRAPELVKVFESGRN